MALRHIVVREDEGGEGGEELSNASVQMFNPHVTPLATHPIVVLIEVFRDHGFVPRERLLQVRERVARDAERRRLDVVRELVEPGGGRATLARHPRP